MNRFQFVADHCTTFEVKRLCTLVEIERSSYYAWLKAAPARRQRAAADAALAARIRVVHDDDKTQGAPRITAELNDGADAGAGERVNHKRVARVMREHGIAGYRRRRKVRTTIPEPADRRVPDLLRRDFTAPAPNQRYVGDITYLPLADGSNLYLATVIDCYSRRLAGWSITDHMRTELVEDALQAAAATRGSLAGAIFQSDHGAVHLQGLRRPVQPTRGHPVHGRRRDQRRQQPRRIVQRHPQKRDPPRPQHLARPDHLPPRSVPVDHPLQHPPTTLLVPLPLPEHLRNPLPRYAPVSGVIHHPCPRTGGKAPANNVRTCCCR